MKKSISVLIASKAVTEPGILMNTALVVGLTVGRELPESTFGPDAVDGDGSAHRSLTNIAHFVLKASPSKLRSLRAKFMTMPDVSIVDYTDDAAPSDYATYEETLKSHSGDGIVYRAIHVYGPEDVVVPLTKNLSRL